MNSTNPHVEPWVSTKLSDAFDIDLGKMLSPEATGGRHLKPYLANRNVQWNRFELDGLGAMNFSSAERQRFRLASGDLLICEGGEIGRTAIWGGELPECYFQKAIHRLRPKVNPVIDPRFMLHYMRYAVDNNLLPGLIGQTSIAHLTQEKLALLEVRHSVSIREQRRIAEILDTIDTGIVATRLVADKLSALSAGLVRERLTSMTASVRHFVPLRDVAQVLSGVTLGSEPSGFGSVEVPYLRVANVQDGYIDTTDVKAIRILRSQLPRYLLRKGDVLLTEGGDLDKLGRGAMWDGLITECICQNHIFRVRCDESRVLPGYLSLYSGSSMGKAYFLKIAKQTTNLATINSTQLKAMPLPVPSLEDQVSLIGLMASCTANLEVERRRLSKLESIKQGVMDDLLTGRVRVTGVGVRRG